jgi:hypothetical protein
MTPASGGLAIWTQGGLQPTHTGAGEAAPAFT